MELEEGKQNNEIIVKAAQNGNLESFGTLYRLYYSSVVALAYSVLTDRDLAEDVAQEVFVIACKDIASLKHPDKFGPWLAGICRNVARQMLRSRSKTIIPQIHHSGEDQHNHELRSDVIRRAVWQLPMAERELIVLRYYDEFSYAQIANVLDISPSAVNGRLVRAKRKIAKYLRRNGFEGDGYETS